MAEGVRQLQIAEGDVERLRAVVNGLQDGVVILNPDSDLAAANEAAAVLLGLVAGRNSFTDFDAALARLGQRALNRSEVDRCRASLDSDPTAAVECMWRFTTEPTHLWVVSRPVQNKTFQGRTWVFYDESATSQALEALELAHAQLRASADGMLDPQALLQAVRDTGGQIVDFVYRDVNRATCTYLGLDRDELVGHSVLTSMPNLKPSGLLAKYARCVTTRDPLIVDEIPYDNDILAGPRFYDVRGNHVGRDLITVTWRDVTDRVDSGRRLAESEERFRLLAANASDVVMHIRDGGIAWVSPSVQDALGAPPQRWIGRPVTDIIPEEDRQAQDKVVWLSADRAVIPRGRVKTVDGTPHWVHVHARTFYDAAGNPDGYISAFRIIDEEVEALNEVEAARRQQAESDKRYRRLMDNSAVGMSIVTPDGRFDVVNRALCDFFGYDAETLQTKTWQELTAPGSMAEDQRRVDDLLAGRIDRFRITKQYVHADGHLIWGDLSVSCLRDADGEVEYLISQTIDITAEVQIRRQIALRDQQNRALAQDLQAQTDRLRSELQIARDYVTSLLPADIDGPVQVTHRSVPCRELGGDCFDYRWIDGDHLLVYLIDVSGHGIAPALEAISVHNLLRSGSLPAATLLQPDRVLAELNSKFPMDQHGGNFFTMWYGVYHAASRTLRYASAGHPPPLAFPAAGADGVQLSGPGFPIGMFADTEFGCQSYPLPPGAEVVVYSDGAFELPLPEGETFSLPDFIELCKALRSSDQWTVDALAESLRARTVAGVFEDDCSLLRLRFP